MSVMPSRILVADEEVECSRTLCGVLQRDGHAVDVIPDGERARQLLETENVDLLIADLVIPGLDGFELLQAAQRSCPGTPVILVSGFGTVETAVRALRMGAYHYFQKPLDFDAVRATVTEALDKAASSARRRRDPTAPDAVSFDLEDVGIVGRGPWLEEVMRLLCKLAPTRATALLTGESGTGKELFARAIHRLSGRKGPFVAVSCGALARDLLESELFGHEKGAFTGADRQKTGRFELADGGTLLLDEVGDIPLDLQVKLLRVLQEREFERVGGTETIGIDVRIVAATNHDLAAAVRERTFREDLYYRLKVVEINLPPLRERPHDVEPLTRTFVETYARRNGKSVCRVGAEVLDLLQRYPWPGNVRELENAIERAVVLSEPWTEELDGALLPENIRFGTPALYPNAAWLSLPSVERENGAASRHYMDEREWINSLAEALQRTGGNAAAAARLLGTSAASVRRMADRYGLRRKAVGGRPR